MVWAEDLLLLLFKYLDPLGMPFLQQLSSGVSFLYVSRFCAMHAWSPNDNYKNGLSSEVPST